MMKKIMLLAGAGIGFVAGSRMGREPYEKLDAQVRKLLGRPEVQKNLDHITAVATDQASTVLHTVAEKVPGVDVGDKPADTGGDIGSYP